MRYLIILLLAGCGAKAPHTAQPAPVSQEPCTVHSDQYPECWDPILDNKYINPDVHEMADPGTPTAILLDVW